MRRSRGSQKVVAAMVIVAFCFLSVVVAPVQAAMVGTAEILQASDRDMAREKVDLFLDRHDVAQHLQAWGVDAKEAKARVQSMTDEEISLLVSKIDQVPAGGDALGFVLALAVVTFVVLIILDIAGVTDVFTFIKKR